MGGEGVVVAVAEIAGVATAGVALLPFPFFFAAGAAAVAIGVSVVDAFSELFAASAYVHMCAKAKRES